MAVQHLGAHHDAGESHHVLASREGGRRRCCALFARVRAALFLATAPPPSPPCTILRVRSSMQATDGPALDISEIMHPMSPSPAPPPLALPPQPQVLAEPPQTEVEAEQERGNDASQPTQVDAHATQAREARHPARATPEPLDQAELESMRQRVLELGLPSQASPNATPLERELANMVRTYCTSPPN